MDDSFDSFKLRKDADLQWNTVSAAPALHETLILSIYNKNSILSFYTGQNKIA